MTLSARSFSLFKRDVFLFITNLITGVVVARKLGPTALGLWVVLQMILAYAESFGRLKFDIAVVYFLGKKKYEIGDVVYTLNALALMTSLLIVAVVLWQFNWFYGVLFANSDVDVSLFMRLILLQIPLHFVGMNYTYLYIYREDVKLYNRMVVIRSLFSSVASICLLLVFDLGLLGVVIATVTSVLIALLYGVVKFGPVQAERRAVNVHLVKDLLSYGSKLYVAGIVGQLNAYVTRLIMVFYLLPAQVAYFAMAQNLGQLLNKVPDALNAMLYPRISKMGQGGDSAKLAANAFRVVLLILIAGGIAGFFLIKPLVHVLYGEAFLEMVVPFRIILPGLVLSGATTVLDQYFAGSGRADISAKIAVLPLAIQVTTALALVPAMGIVGAALAFLVTLLSLSLLQIFVFVKLSACVSKADLIIRTGDFRTVFVFVKSIGRKLSVQHQ